MGCEVWTHKGQGKLTGTDTNDEGSFALVNHDYWSRIAKPYLKRLPEGTAPTCDMAAQGYDCHNLIDSGEAIEVEVWKPKKGEVCWFWDDGDYGHGPRVRRFEQNSGSMFVDMEENSHWNFCAPFTGELPEYWAKKWG
jgi:hypothetical protein